jgi:hypothetical protein
MNKRLKEIDDFVDSIKTENEFNSEIQQKMEKYKEKFYNELLDYNPVISLKDLYNLKSAGYIRYVNFNNEIKYGGILLKIFKTENEDEISQKNLILLQNSNNKKWTISWENNYIFYKKQTKKGDNMRNLFISLLDKDI